MPELAEVETVRRQVVKVLRGKKIKDVTVDEEDRFLYAFAKAKDVRKALKGATIKGAGRKGKYFWLELDRKPWPLFHLGMSGNIAFVDPKKKTGPQHVWGGAKMWSERDLEKNKRLWFCRLLIVTTSGVEMAFLDPRRFGRMWLVDDPWESAKIKKLKNDPLVDFPKVAELKQKLSRRKKAIKSVLLDQGIFAGIGNWLADEILYHAQINPHKLASALTPNEVEKLHSKILFVVKKAVAVNADYDRFPKNWLFHHRWGKVKTAQTSRQQKIIHEEIGGRTTAWVPGWQK